jgi:hypothetical protein
MPSIMRGRVRGWYVMECYGWMDGCYDVVRGCLVMYVCMYVRVVSGWMGYSVPRRNKLREGC